MPRVGDIYGRPVARVLGSDATVAERLRDGLRTVRSAILRGVEEGDADGFARARLMPGGVASKKAVNVRIDPKAAGPDPGGALEPGDEPPVERRAPPLDLAPMPYTPRVVLLFAEPPFALYRDGGGRFRDDSLAAAFARLDRLTGGGVHLQRALTSVPDHTRRRLLGRAADNAYAVRVRPGVDPYRVLAELNEMLVVERERHGRPPLLKWGYVEPLPGPPPATPTDSLVSQQAALLQQSPGSIGLKGAWDREVYGQGVRFVDIEQGWLLCHDDLPKAPDGTPAITPLWGVNLGYGHHGTAVLGLLNATHGDGYGAGVAPRAEGRVASVWSVEPDGVFDRGQGWGVPAFGTEEELLASLGWPLWHNTPNAILAALAWLRRGDVLVLEHQVGDTATFDGRTVYTLLPPTADPLTHAMVRTARNLGVIVVEAAGNGGYPLDQYVDPLGRYVFGNPGLHSGSIMVGAADARAPHDHYASPTAASNYGTRVDNYAWGLDVATIGDPQAPYDPTGWNTDFRATSASTALVACAAVALQSAHLVNHPDPLTPEQMRQRLYQGGVPSGDGLTYPIGRMPDLEPQLDAALSAGSAPTAADLWLRDGVLDMGEPLDVRDELARWSPDLVTVDTLLGHAVAEGEPLFLDTEPRYRLEAVVRNKGGRDAVDVAIDVYLLPMVGGELPHHESLATVVEAVLAGGAASATPVRFPTRLPGFGEYSDLYVAAVVRGDDDEAGEPPDSPREDLFLRWVTGHDNVAVRKFKLEV